MHVFRLTSSAASLCVLLLLVACRNTPSNCPQASVIANPEIPEGASQTDLFVEVTNPNLGNELGVITKLTAFGGVIADPYARETTFACEHDFSGPAEICVNATYAQSDGGVAGVEDPSVGTSIQYLRGPNVYLYQPLDCSETQCTTVICPEEKNACPAVSSLTVEPMVVPEGGTATIEVIAEDPDDGPETPLLTTLDARHGTIADVNARMTTYTCDPEIGGAIEICVVASDGDSSCDDELCTWVRCPGDPLENTCPIIEDFAAEPNPIPTGETTTTITVDASDPDEFPEPLMTVLSSLTGAFEDATASETTFRCGEPGPVEVCVDATDGDPTCDDVQRCLTVQCPGDVPSNLCPNLFVINPVPRVVPQGETSTRVETRAQDTDGLPLPLKLTLHALWGSFENTFNIQEPNHAVAQNATYVCDRPGQVEVCVEATDGACVKTLCDDITCPEDVPTQP